jgi:ATP-binding cassette subfamily B protein
MDPAIGRQWVTIEAFTTQLFSHSIEVDAEDWLAWATGTDTREIFANRLQALGASHAQARTCIDLAVDQHTWRAMAALDAALRMLSSLNKARALHAWQDTESLLASLLIHAIQESPESCTTIPARYWSVRPGANPSTALILTGAVLLRVSGCRQACDEQQDHAKADDAGEDCSFSPALAAAMSEAPVRPSQELWRLVRAEGLLTPLALTMALGLAMGALIVEALLFRGLFDLAHEFSVTSQRIFAVSGLLVFVLLLWIFELSLVGESFRLGRHLETRLRVLLMAKLPRLNDRYLQSRPVSDMAERSHSIYALRDLPEQVALFTRTAWELMFTLIGIGLIAPQSLGLAVAIAASTLLLLVCVQPAMSERDLRVRNQLGSLQKFYLDALLGIVPIRTHSAERSVQREHEGLLVEWARSALRPLRLTIVVEGLRGFGSLLLIGWLLYAHIRSSGVTGDLLLLVYWVLKLPALGEQLVSVVLQYPTQRSISLRLLELIKSPDDDAAESPLLPVSTNIKSCGVSIGMHNVGVVAAGHTILSDVNLCVRPGEHIAIVGPSGAGKSSLLGLLLGFHQSSGAPVLIDGQPLDANRLAQLRQHTAWVDPAVQIWNRSLLENLHYSPITGPYSELGLVLGGADLVKVLAHLPDGLQSTLSEGGARLSGGEGQRVRLARAMWQREINLVLLDEPFRGLDRAQRQRHLNTARHCWQDATLLCITHDVAETKAFARVLVVDQGRIIEDGSPHALMATSNSRYRHLLDVETSLQQGCWSQDDIWRRLRLEDGRIKHLPKSMAA